MRLFHRSTRSITLTAQGTQCVERCRRVLTELEVAGEELSQNVSLPQGPLRISLPMIARLFVAIFGEFQSRYQDIQLDLEFTDRLTDVITEGFDAVIRSGAPKDSGLSARSLGTYRMLTVASPAYLARRGVPQCPKICTSRRAFISASHSPASCRRGCSNATISPWDWNCRGR